MKNKGYAKFVGQIRCITGNVQVPYRLTRLLLLVLGLFLPNPYCSDWQIIFLKYSPNFKFTISPSHFYDYETVTVHTLLLPIHGHPIDLCCPWRWMFSYHKKLEEIKLSLQVILFGSSGVWWWVTHMIRDHDSGFAFPPFLLLKVETHRSMKYWTLRHMVKCTGH